MRWLMAQEILSYGWIKIIQTTTKKGLTNPYRILLWIELVFEPLTKMSIFAPALITLLIIPGCCAMAHVAKWIGKLGNKVNRAQQIIIIREFTFQRQANWLAFFIPPGKAFLNYSPEATSREHYWLIVPLLQCCVFWNHSHTGWCNLFGERGHSFSTHSSRKGDNPLSSLAVVSTSLLYFAFRVAQHSQSTAFTKEHTAWREHLKPFTAWESYNGSK